MGYFYYFLRQNDFNSKSFLVFFFLIKYFQYTIGIQWPIAQFSLFFDTNSVLTNIGLIFHLNFNFLSFVLAFGFTFVDYAILVLFYKFVSFFSTKILDITSFEMLISNFSVQNFKKISKDFFGKPLTTKLKTTILLVLIVLAPIAYTDSMETIHETNNGIYYLTSGLNLIIGYFEKNSGFSGFFSKSNELLNVKNIIYFAGKDFQLSRLEFNSLNSPLYAPFLMLLGMKDQTNVSLAILSKLSEFVSVTLLNLVTSIEEYNSYMYQLTQEILRRAYWWVLEENNITYNPKRDFYDKFNNQNNINLNNSITEFNLGYIDLQSLVNISFLKGISTINNFFKQMNKLSLILNQVLYLTKLAPPLLNATFMSVEVTNALAFDQFITARNLTNQAQIYLNQSQEILSNYSFDPSLSPGVAEIGTIMNEFNYINHEFYNMTFGTENMFLNISRSISDLNSTSFSSYKVQDQTQMNNDINSSINYVRQVVLRNIDNLNIF